MSDDDLLIGPPPEPAAGPGVPDPDPEPTPRWHGPPASSGPIPEPQPAAPQLDLVAYAEHLEPQLRAILASLSGLVSITPLADEDVPDHWRFTDDELDELVPPLARIAARRAEVAAAIEHGDELAVGLTLMGYAGRNITAGYLARQDREEHPDDRYDDPEGAQQRGQADAAARARDAGADGDAGGPPAAWSPPPAGTGINPPAA